MRSGLIWKHVLLACLVVAVLLSQSRVADSFGQDQSQADVDGLIQETGRTSPDWWETVELSYPEDLDLSWPVQPGFQQGPVRFEERERRGRRGGPGRRGESFGAGGRGFRREQGSPSNVDEYLIQIVYPNPSRHKAGIKLVHHLMIQHKDDREKLKRSLSTLGWMFYELFDDYARAAFWWQKSREMGGSIDGVMMARCYFELGSKASAVELLSHPDNRVTLNRKDGIKLWAKMGEVDRALAMIESSSATNDGEANRLGPRDRGGMSRSDKYLLAAEICRGAGRYEDAIPYYEKVLALPDSETRPMNHHETDDKFHAKVNLAATRQLKRMDLQRIPDGSYTAVTEAYGGPMTVQVVLHSGRIESVDITRHQETFSYFAKALPTARQIVTKQGFKGVDVVTGATVTSDAIINTAVAALVNAME